MTEKNKSKCNISRTCLEVPLKWIVTKFGMCGHPGDLINCNF